MQLHHPLRFVKMCRDAMHGVLRIVVIQDRDAMHGVSTYHPTVMVYSTITIFLVAVNSSASRV
jgi:hypothetical protein